MIYQFGEFALDEGLLELRRNGQPVPAEPKVFNVLLYLLQHRGRVVPKEELFARLWPDQVVSDSALTSCIKALRTAVGDAGASQKVIKTVHARGYRFVAELRADESRANHQPRTDFVGREQELHQLRGALDDAFAGHGGLILLVGEAGIGKTRTADELAVIGQRRGALVLLGRCYEGDGAPAFWPWIQAVRGAIRERDPAALAEIMGAGAADIAQVIPEVRERLPAVATPPALASEQARFRFFDSVVTFFKRAADRQPTVIILDDLHWADRASLLLLEFLARELRDSHLLVIGTYRDVDLGAAHALTQTLGELARSEVCHRIVLRGLAEREVGCFIERVSGAEPVAALVAAVHRETDGNPFFVTEVVRLLADEGGLQDAPRGSERTWSIPQTVREAVNRRLSGVSDACSRVLQVAAVIGREFTLPTLKRASESATRPARSSPTVSATPVLDALDEARNARLIEHVAWTSTPFVAERTRLGRYRFSHALVRETLYEALPDGERTRLHRVVGDALEDIHHVTLEVHVAEIAHHYFAAAEAGEVGKAMDYAMRAAQRAAALFAYEEAALHYERAVQLCELSAPNDAAIQPCELLLGLGENQWRAGAFDRARATFQQAATVARGLPSADLLARAALGYGGEFRGFDLGVVEPTLIELLEEALQQVGSADSGWRARLMARLAVALYHVPDSLRRREELTGEAVAVATRVGDGPAQLAALYSRQWAIWGPENLEERLAAVTEMARVADRLGDRDAALHAHRFCFIDLMDLGDVGAANIELETCARLATELRQPYYVWYVTTFRALRAFLDGRFDESERLAQEALKVGQRAQSQNVAQTYGLQIFGVRREQGRLAELEPAFQNFVERYPALPSWRAGLTFLLAELGREADARAHFEVLAANDFAAVARDSFWLAAMATICDACVFLGDVRRAAVLYALLEPYARCNITDIGVLCFGSAARYLGRLAAVVGEWDTAEQHFVEALRMDRHVGGRSLIAHTQHEYAEMLLQRGRPNDASIALQHLDPALTAYEQLGMRTFYEKAAALKRQAEETRAEQDKAANESGRRRSRVTLLRPR